MFSQHSCKFLFIIISLRSFSFCFIRNSRSFSPRFSRLCRFCDFFLFSRYMSNSFTSTTVSSRLFPSRKSEEARNETNKKKLCLYMLFLMFADCVSSSFSSHFVLLVDLRMAGLTLPKFFAIVTVRLWTRHQCAFFALFLTLLALRFSLLKSSSFVLSFFISPLLPLCCCCRCPLLLFFFFVCSCLNTLYTLDFSITFRFPLPLHLDYSRCCNWRSSAFTSILLQSFLF